MTTASLDVMTAHVEGLESSFPMGMFDADQSPGSSSATRALQIIEKIVHEASIQNALYARYALVQLLPRFMRDERSAQAGGESFLVDVPDFVRQYAAALSPDWYSDFFSLLTDEEVEIFLKHYLHAHETWGHSEGIGDLVRTMLESSLHAAVPLLVRELEEEDRPIPTELYSKLGRKENHSYLGKNFVLGKRVVCRAERYEIVVGPIGPVQLDAFQRAGWAEGIQASQKLYRLVEFAEPFYLRAEINFLFERVGFVLGKAETGRDRLGIVENGMQERMAALVGAK
jgi:hypothetical protein